MPVPIWDRGKFWFKIKQFFNKYLTRKVYGVDYWVLYHYKDGRVEKDGPYTFVDAFTDGKEETDVYMVYFKCDQLIQDKTGIFSCKCGFVRRENKNSYIVEFVNHPIKESFCQFKRWEADLSHFYYFKPFSLFQTHYKDLKNMRYIDAETEKA
jgi:hypothetical protein